MVPRPRLLNVTDGVTTSGVPTGAREAQFLDGIIQRAGVMGWLAGRC